MIPVADRSCHVQGILSHHGQAQVVQTNLMWMIWMDINFSNHNLHSWLSDNLRSPILGSLLLKWFPRLWKTDLQAKEENFSKSEEMKSLSLISLNKRLRMIFYFQQARKSTNFVLIIKTGGRNQPLAIHATLIKLNHDTCNTAIIFSFLN